MKKILFTIYVFINCGLFSQQNNISTYPMVEILPIAKSLSNPLGITTFNFYAISQVWGGATTNTTYESSYTWLTNEYNSLTYQAINNGLIDEGWDFVTSSSGYSIFGYGKYKLEVGNKYFYLDYRDDRIGYYNYMGTPTGHPLDIWIKYNVDNSTLYINSYDDDIHWQNINNGVTINFWELKGMGTPSTAKFEPYAPENLIISLSNGKPYLAWQHHSPADDFWLGYKIYRCITVENETPVNYEEIATVGSTTNSYIDNNLCFANWKNIYYKIKAINAEEYSEFSNTVQINLTQEIINCNLTLNSNLSVPTGKVLNINSGITLSFASGCALIVNGTLNAAGTSTSGITFTKSGTNNWGGIQFNSGSSGNLQYCTIQYGSHGVYCYNSSPTISYSHIQNNQNNGVYCNYYSSPVLDHNTIQYNYTGISCSDHSSPNMLSIGSYPGQNVVRNNGSWGISTNYYSNPIVGSSSTYGGGNSIYSNGSGTSAISAINYCTINAQKDWWNYTTTPYYSTSYFYLSNSTINADPGLATDPNAGRTRIISDDSQETDKINISLSKQIENDDLSNAQENENNKKYDEAIILYLNAFKNSKDELLSKYILCKIEECFTKGEKKDYLDFSKKEIKPLLKEGSELYESLLELETHQMINNGLYKEAIENMQSITQKYNLSSEIDKHTLFTLGAVYSLYYGDKAKADKYFDELKKKYPADQIVEDIDRILSVGILNPEYLSTSPSVTEAIETSETKETEIRDGISNYPNPFNPTTQINFVLKQNGKVTLRVYDVLGKEVANLVDGLLEAGKHTATFNGSNLASGIYFYRLTTPTTTITKKMMLIK